MEITLYTFEDRDGQPVELESFHSFDEANDYAQVHALRLIQETYEYTESMMVADFTVEPCEHDWYWLQCGKCGGSTQTVG